MNGEDAHTRLARLETLNTELRERLETAERYTAQTLQRATRLAQVISVLGHDTDLDTLVDRTSIELAELFAADMAVLMLGSAEALTVAAQSGVRQRDLPTEPFALAGLEALTAEEPVRIGPAGDVGLPPWLEAYGAQHVAWVRLALGEQSLGVMLLVRRVPQAFARSDGTELRAVAQRIAMAIDNGLLNRRMREQIVRLHRLQELTAELAATLELEDVGQRVAEMLVSEVPVTGCAISVQDGAGMAVLSEAGWAGADGDERFVLEAAGTPVGAVQVAGAPAEGSADREVLLQILGLAALALDKALLYERSQEQARHDSLTGLLCHRVFQEILEEEMAARRAFSVVLMDIDDFKSINDLHGHHAGDETLRRVARALCDGARAGDTVFRVGGEEFCAVLPGLGPQDAYAVAERLRTAVAASVSALPVTVSVGVASFPAHGEGRSELLELADAALYASKRHGKNRTTMAGTHELRGSHSTHRGGARLAMLYDKDPDTVAHSLHVATLAVDIARRLDMDDARMADLRTAAQLHDIGKVGVPDVILGKPGPLAEEELRVIRTHPIVGSELLKAWGEDRPAEFVLQHHERVDGEGYPAGLRGEAIALESRVIQVADAYVAMTLDRPYRAAVSREEAVAELLRHRGTQFDPRVVDALVSLERVAVAA